MGEAKKNPFQESIDRVTKYRGLSRVLVGQLCEVDGKLGIIVGGNSAANFDVLFHGWSGYSNCHPGWRFKIFNAFGGIQYASGDCDRLNNEAGD